MFRTLFLFVLSLVSIKVTAAADYPLKPVPFNTVEMTSDRHCPPHRPCRGC